MAGYMMTPRDVADKIDWEGGLYETAFGYGLYADEIEPGELHDAWAEMERVHSEAFGPALARVKELLPESDTI